MHNMPPRGPKGAEIMDFGALGFFSQTHGFPPCVLPEAP